MRGIVQRVTVLTALVALFLSFSAPTLGHVTEKTDSTKSPSALDIRKATFRHGEGRFRVSAITEGGWAADLLGADDGVEGNDNAFQFQFNSKGDNYADYVVVVDYNADDDLFAALYHWVPPYPTQKPPKYVSDVFVKKEGRTLRVSFFKRKVDPRKSYIGWKAESYFKDDGECSHQCHDKAPNGRQLANHTL